jgi:pilus assembly protein CpaF
LEIRLSIERICIEKMGLFTKSSVEEEVETARTVAAGETTPARKESEDKYSDPEKLFGYALDYISAPEHNWLSNVMRNTMTKEKFFKLVREELTHVAGNELIIDQACAKLETYIWGYYIVEPFINDDSVSDIRVIDENHVRLKRNGERESATWSDGTPVTFMDEEDYIRFVNIICSRNKISLADSNAIATFTDADNNPNARLRFDLMSGLLNSTRKPYVVIRKVPKKKKSLDDLVKLDVLPQELADYLKQKAKTSSGIIFTGKGASGKTTVMNAMLDEIPQNRSGLVIQENEELFSEHHPDLMFQHVLTSRDESHIQYTLKDLATNGLLIDLDYFIIGEIKGDEAAYFMNASYTGHQCWTSVHGMNSQEAMRKLADYVTYATRYSLKDAYNMLRFMNIVIFMRSFKVEEISEVTGVDHDTGELTYRLVYKRGEVMDLDGEGNVYAKNH